MKLSDVQLVERMPYAYLDHRAAIFRRIFVYQAIDVNKPATQGILGLFIIEGNNADEVAAAAAAVVAGAGAEAGAGGGCAPGALRCKAYVWVSQTAGVGSKPAVASMFRQLCPSNQDACQFVTSITTSVADSFNACNEKLSGYLRDKKGPTVIIAQAGGAMLDARHWRRQLSLLQEFPLILMPANTQDSQFPALLWQSRIARIMIQRFLFFPTWYDDRLRSARFAQVPIGNLGKLFI
jgi:hypothetical protein